MSDTPEIAEPSPDGGLADRPLTAQRLAKHQATLGGGTDKGVTIFGKFKLTFIGKRT